MLYLGGRKCQKILELLELKEWYFSVRLKNMKDQEIPQAYGAIHPGPKGPGFLASWDKSKNVKRLKEKK